MTILLSSNYSTTSTIGDEDCGSQSHRRWQRLNSELSMNSTHLQNRLLHTSSEWNLYFSANSVAQDKKVATFLSVVGPTVYSTLRDLFAPTSPKDKTLRQIFDRLKLHFEPKRTVIIERYHFYKRDQAAGESIADYMKLLSKILPHTVHFLLPR